MDKEIKILEVKPAHYDSITGISLCLLPLHVLFFTPLVYMLLMFTIYFPRIPEHIASWILLTSIIAYLALWIRVILEYRKVFKINRIIRMRSYTVSAPSKSRQSVDLSHGFKSKFYKSAVNRLFGYDSLKEIDERSMLGQRVATTDVWDKTVEYRLYDTQSTRWQNIFNPLIGLEWGFAPVKRSSRRYCYTVFEAQLGGHVPHLVFDSKQANKQQFKSSYSQLHKLQLDAHFDTFFTSYTPKVYSVDALSAVTPEVLEAMISLQNCDIELVDDRMFCYAPPLADERQLADFRELCLKLHAKLNDNLLLRTFAKKKENPFKGKILRNPFRFIKIIVMFTFVSLSLYIHSSNPLTPTAKYDNRNGFKVIAVILALVALLFIALMIEEYRHNRKNSNRTI